MNTPADIFYNICSSCNYNNYRLALNDAVAYIEEHDDDYSVRVPEFGVRFLCSDIEDIAEGTHYDSVARVKVRNKVYEVSIFQPLHVDITSFQD